MRLQLGKRSASTSPARRSRSAVLLEQVKLRRHNDLRTCGHHFQRTGLGLAFKRSLVRPNGEETPLEVSLRSSSSEVNLRALCASQITTSSASLAHSHRFNQPKSIKRLVDSLDESAKFI